MLGSAYFNRQKIQIYLIVNLRLLWHSWLCYFAKFFLTFFQIARFHPSFCKQLNLYVLCTQQGLEHSLHTNQIHPRFFNLLSISHGGNSSLAFEVLWDDKNLFMLKFFSGFKRLRIKNKWQSFAYFYCPNVKRNPFKLKWTLKSSQKRN